MILRSDPLKDKKIQFEVCKMNIIDFACAQIAKKMDSLKEIWRDLKGGQKDLKGRQKDLKEGWTVLKERWTD